MQNNLQSTMPALDITVSLSEILEFRGGPVTEPEIWAILCQSAEALQDLFITGQSSDEFGPTFVINPDTIGLSSDGRIHFGDARRVQQYVNYMSPETQEGQQGMLLTNSGIEQLYLFALGKSLIYAAEYGLRTDQPLNVSRSLESLLRSMCGTVSAERTPLVSIMEACGVYLESQVGREAYSQTVVRLYRAIFGGDIQDENQHDSTYGSDQSRQGTLSLPDSERSRRKQRRHRHSDRRHKKRHNRSRSRSNTESGSRSRSRSRRRGRDKESPDSGYHRDVAGRKYPNRHTSEFYTTGYTTGRSYHLSDITFSASQNQHSSSGSDYVTNKSSPKNMHLKSNTQVPEQETNREDLGNPAYQKYLKLRNRQKKLRALRRGLADDESEDLPPLMVCDTRSQTSLASTMQGAYQPDVHLKYGSNMALKMGVESDRDSIISSEVSLFPRQNQQLRADISDPYLQELLNLTSSLPPPPPIHVPQPQSRQQLASPTNTLKKSKEFYGPEFIQGATKPITRIPIHIQSQIGKHAGRLCRVVVVLLTGHKLELVCDPSTTGQQLFEAVLTHIELPEFFFFGLTFISDGEHFFIEPGTKLHKVAPEGWKEGWKGPAPSVTFTLHLRVKYYPENLSILRHETTVHLLYLQLRHDILEERCLCDDEKAVALAGLALQAEYGDYNRETMGANYFTPEHYFSQRAVSRLGSGFVRDNTPDAHVEAAGLTEAQAETRFIKLIQGELAEYGIHFYKLLRSKNDTSNVLWVGVSVNHLSLCEQRSGDRSLFHQYPWSAIQKISFNRRRFSVQPKPDLGQSKLTKMNFFTNTYRKGKYLLNFSTSQHSFQMKMRSRMMTQDEAGLDFGMDHASIGGTEDMVDIDREDPSVHDINSVQDSAGHGMGASHDPRTYRHPPPYHPDTSASMIDLPTGVEHNMPRHGMQHAHTVGHVNSADLGNHGPRMPEDRDMVQHDEHVSKVTVPQTNKAYVIDMSSQSMDQTLPAPSANETISNTLHHRFNNELLSPEPSPERQIFEVVLEKESPYGIGITIVGGDNTSRLDLGIFIKSVTPGGPADRDGRIKPGDRLVAINDQSLEGVQHHTAVSMIKASTEPVKLLVSQVKPPGSLRRRSNANDDAVFLHKLRQSYEGQALSHDRQSSIDSHVNSQYVDYPSIVQSPVEEDGEQLDAEVSIPLIVAQEDHSAVQAVGSLLHSSGNPRIGKPLKPFHKQDELESGSEDESDFEEAIQSAVEGKKLQTPLHGGDSTDGTTKPQPGAPLTYEVILEKEKGSFGLNVTGGVNTSVRHGGIYVKSLVPGGAAHRGGSIIKGDRILQVNDTPLTGYTHRQAVELLCKAPLLCRLVMQRDDVPTDSQSPVESISKQATPTKKATPPARVTPVSRSMSQSPAESIEELETKMREELEAMYKQIQAQTTPCKVLLEKGSRGLGFSIHGGWDPSAEDMRECVIRVKRLFPGEPAEKCGKMHSGDVILEINGRSIQGTTRAETIATLRRAPIPVEMLLCTPGEDLLPPLSFMGSEESLEMTPVSSTSQLSNYDTSSDSEENTPAMPREKLITPPDEFDLPIYPTDAHGNIVCKAASPPPPLPVSPPPLLVKGIATPVNEVDVEIVEVYHSPLQDLPNDRDEDITPMQNGNSLYVIEGENLYLVDREDVTPTFTQDFSGEIAPRNSPDDMSEVAPRNSPAYSGEVTPANTPQYARRVTEDSPSSERSGSRNSVIETMQKESVGANENYVTRQDHFVTDSETESSRDAVNAGLAVNIGLRPEVLAEDSLHIEDGDSLTESNHYTASILDSAGYTGDGSESDSSSGSESERDILKQYENKKLDVENNDVSFDNVDVRSYNSWSERPGAEDKLDVHSYNSVERPGSSGSDSSVVRQRLSPFVDPEPLEPGELEVVLEKGKLGGLGFTVAGGADTTGGCYIKGIVQDPALSDGTLQPGDQLIRVNGTDMTELNHFEAVTVLRETAKVVTIRVLRDPELRLSDEKYDEQSTSGIEAKNSRRTWGDLEQKRATLIKDVTAETGFPDEEASESEESEEDSEDDDVDTRPVHDLQQAADRLQLDSSQDEDDLAEDQLDKWGPETGSPETAQTQVIPVELEKPQTGGLGISLVTAETKNHTGIFVKTITPGGVVDTDGRLQVGDKLLKINSESVVGMKHTKAAAMLRSCEGVVCLTVSRGGINEQFRRLSTDSHNPPAETKAKASVLSDQEEESSLSLSEQYSEGIEGLAVQAEMYLDNAKLECDLLESPVASPVFTSDVDDVDGLKVVDAVVDSLAVSEGDSVKEESSENATTTTSSEGEFCDALGLVRDKAYKERQKAAAASWSMVDDGVHVNSASEAVPDIITRDWLCSLKLLHLGEEAKGAISEWISRLKEKMKNDDPAEEFKNLKKVKATDKCEVAKAKDNKTKNRFRNVLPYDFNRVKLSYERYINASLVEMEVAGQKLSYIACQGPLPQTADDFWEMVWLSQVEAIVMLTLDMEAKKVKCHRYWPDAVETPMEVCNGRYILQLVGSNRLEDFIVRQIVMEDSSSGTQRKVLHVNYTTWPDHDVPSTAKPILQCIRLGHLAQGGGPLVVHCSAGIGRTGAFITIDVAMEQLIAGLQCDIYEIVKELRRQRQGMIQTRDQYYFCYSACVEALSSC